MFFLLIAACVCSTYSTRYTPAHKAGNSSSEQSFQAQFSQILTLVGCQLTDPSNLYTYRSKVGESAQCICGDQNRLRIRNYSGSFHLPERVVSNEFIKNGFFA